MTINEDEEEFKESEDEEELEDLQEESHQNDRSELSEENEAFSQVPELIKAGLYAKKVEKDEDAEQIELGPQQEKMVRWMEHSNRINKNMQTQALQFSKEVQSSMFGSGTLNSYAFHSKALMNTLQSILPVHEKKKVE